MDNPEKLAILGKQDTGQIWWPFFCFFICVDSGGHYKVWDVWVGHSHYGFVSVTIITKCGTLDQFIRITVLCLSGDSSRCTRK